MLRSSTNSLPMSQNPDSKYLHLYGDAFHLFKSGRQLIHEREWNSAHPQSKALCSNQPDINIIEKFEAALDTYKKALHCVPAKIDGKSDNIPREAEIYEKIGACYLNLGEESNKYSYFEKAFTAFTQAYDHSNSSFTYAYHQITALIYQLDFVDESRQTEILNKAIAISDRAIFSNFQSELPCPHIWDQRATLYRYLHKLQPKDISHIQNQIEALYTQVNALNKLQEKAPTDSEKLELIKLSHEADKQKNNLLRKFFSRDARIVKEINRLNHLTRLQPYNDDNKNLMFNTHPLGARMQAKAELLQRSLTMK